MGGELTALLHGSVRAVMKPTTERTNMGGAAGRAVV